MKNTKPTLWTINDGLGSSVIDVIGSAYRSSLPHMRMPRQRVKWWYVPMEIFGRKEKPPFPLEYTLTGFYDHVNLIEKKVGKYTFSVPDIDDMRHLYVTVLKSKGMTGLQRLSAMDVKRREKGETANHASIAHTAVTWVEKAIQELDGADKLFAKKNQGDDRLAHQLIEEAQRSFAIAQDLSRIMRERYFPEYEPESE